MKTNPIFTRLLLASAFLFLIGCETHDIQTTSGRDYISKYASQTGTFSSPDIDREVMEVANVEPNLHFPARIGLAKLFNGQMVNLSSDEFEAWLEAKNQLGVRFGDFVPVSALIAESVYNAPAQGSNSVRASELLRKVRLGAARQHIDVVLIYEVFSKTNTRSLSSAVADWTIIGGYIVPTREIETTGFANALLIDVRTGYPYGTASAALTSEDMAPTFISGDRSRRLEDRNQLATVLKLIPEVNKMMNNLMNAFEQDRQQMHGM